MNTRKILVSEYWDSLKNAPQETKGSLANARVRRILALRAIHHRVHFEISVRAAHQFTQHVKSSKKPIPPGPPEGLLRLRRADVHLDGLATSLCKEDLAVALLESSWPTIVEWLLLPPAPFYPVTGKAPQDLGPVDFEKLPFPLPKVNRFDRRWELALCRFGIRAGWKFAEARFEIAIRQVEQIHSFLESNLWPLGGVLFCESDEGNPGDEPAPGMWRGRWSLILNNDAPNFRHFSEKLGVRLQKEFKTSDSPPVRLLNFELR